MNVLQTSLSDADEDANLRSFRVPLRTISHRGAGLVVALLLACAGLVVGAVPAQAAAGGLVVSDPDNRQQVDDAPGAVTLVFEGKVDDRVAKILVLDASGKNVTSGPLVVEATNVTTQLTTRLAKGTYTVHYRVNGSGGEPRGGAFQFSYGQGSFTDLADKSWSGTAQEPEILRGDNPNGPPDTGAPDTDSPGVEVTSSGQPDRSTQTSQPTQTDQPDQTDDPGSDQTEAGQDPSKSATASGIPAQDSGTGRAFLIGGIVLLAALGGTAYGVYHSRRKGTHS